MLWCWWGGSTAAGVTTALPCWCYELIVSFCDQVGSANVINATAVACKSVPPQAANLEWLAAYLSEESCQYPSRGTWRTLWRAKSGK